MIKPTLALIPSGYKGGSPKGTLYSVLPSDGVGDFDFERAGEATRINKEGLIETVSSNVPRLNYPLIDGVVSGCPSLLLEPERTNLITYSEDFSNAAWIKTNSSVTSGFISPDGTLSGAKLNENTVSNTNFRLRVDGAATTGANTLSIFAKAGERNWIMLRENAETGVYAFFNLQDGTIGQSTADDVFMEYYGNGWYKLSITDVLTSVGIDVRIAIADGVDTYNGVIGNGLYVWGAMIEQGSFPTSYIPSLTGSQTTRSAETCNNAGDVNTFNDSEGVLFAEIANIKNDDGVEKRLAIQDGGTFDEVRITFTANTNEIVGVVYNNSSNQCDLIHIVNNTEDFNKIALKYKENDFALWVNGIEVATDNNGSVFNSGSLDELSYDLNNNYKVYGSTKQIQYFDKALTSTDLEELTSWRSFNEMAQAQLYTIL